MRVLGEMKAMKARGHKVALAAPKTSVIFQKAKEESLTPWDLDVRKLMFPSSIMKLARRMRDAGVQVANPHSSADGWIAGIAGRLAGVPLIVRSRHIEVDYRNRASSRWGFGKIPHHVVTTSEQISNGLVDALSLDADEISCIPTGIDLKQFDSELPGTLHNELGLDVDVPLVGMISVIRSWKGHDFFVEAAKEVSRRFPEVHFVVAGGGNDRRLAKIERWVQAAQLSNRFHLLGHRTDVPNLLASYTMLVLPSTGHEGIPQIVLQSHAMQCPVVGTKVGGIPEVVEHGKTGLLVPPQIPRALTKAIVKLLENKKRGKEMAAAGRKFVEAEHSVNHMCERLEKLYLKYLPDE